MNNQIVTRRTHCRLCNCSNLLLVLPIKSSPIGDAFISYSRKSELQPLIPLDLYQCEECGHVQNIDIVNPNILFRNYIFRTSSSMGLIEHFRKYANDVLLQYHIQPGSLIVEVGSNDGTLLSFFKEQGMRVVGVDPALEISQEACAAGIPTIPEFFTSDVVLEIKQKYGCAKLLIANNVYAHSDQLSDMTDAVAAMLDHDGIFVFEVSYLLDIVDNFLFDTIYHEHLSYHSIQPLKFFFQRHGLHLFDVQKVHTKGGSIRGFVQKSTGIRKEQPVIENMIQEEVRRGLYSPDIFHQYENEISIRDQNCHAASEEIEYAHSYLKGIKGDVLLILIPHKEFCPNRLEELANNLGVEKLIFYPNDNYKAFDQSHMTKTGAMAFTKDFINKFEKTEAFKKLKPLNVSVH